MLLEHVLVPGSSAYADALALYEEAFPPEERVDLSILERCAEKPGVEFLAYFDGQSFCGFTYSFDTGAYLYLMYFAVNQNMRSRGFGSRIFERLKSRYPGRTIVLEIEPVDKCARNYEQRLRRYAFYERHGFSLAGFTSYDSKSCYTVLSTRIPLDAEAFMAGVSHVSGGLIVLDLRKD